MYSCSVKLEMIDDYWIMWEEVSVAQMRYQGIPNITQNANH